MQRIPECWWITGASSGIGRALAVRLVAAGHTVYATARNRAELQILAAECGERLIPLPADVADAGAMATLWHTLSQAPARLDGVILAAGICEYVDATALDIASFRRVMDVNFHGAVQSVHAALPLLRAAARDGHRPKLLALGSLSSVAGLPRAEAYGASKAALKYFFDALRVDLGHVLDITLVQPGFVATRLTEHNDFPMPWLWSVDDAANTLFARLWSGRRTIVFPWQLALCLRLAAALPGLWFGLIAPRLRRSHAGATPE
ncbi:MAG TPA: SDR family NAD(P)-dependent oxidoreductase [Pseudomonadales bacterium]